MKIFFERSGGFTGMTTNTKIDTQNLSPQESHKVHEIINNINFFTLSSKVDPPSKGAADYFTYKITIEDEGKIHTVQYNDMTLQSVPSIKPLVNYLLNNKFNMNK